MKKIINKLTSIFCTFILAISMVAFVGCNPKSNPNNTTSNNPPSIVEGSEGNGENEVENGNEEPEPEEPDASLADSNISMEEVKALILQALAIDDQSSQAQNASLTSEQSEQNRDIFVKFGTSIYQNTTSFEGEADTVEQFITKKSDEWDEYYYIGDISDPDRYSEYFDGEVIYTYKDNQVTQSDFINIDQSGAGGGNMSAVLKVISNAFSDDAFDTLYTGQRTKTELSDGFTVTLKLKCIDYERFTYAQFGLDYDAYIQEHPTENSAYLNDDVIVTITFDANQKITKFELTTTAYKEESQQGTSVITLTQYNGELSAPIWLNDTDN